MCSMNRKLIDIEEVLNHSDYADRQELRNSVYVEYLQYLVLKNINDSNLKNTAYLFGSFYNRIRYNIGRFGNSLDFLIATDNIQVFNEKNNKIEEALKLEGYEVSITKISKYKFELEISSARMLDSKNFKPIKFKLHLNYHYASNYFKPSVFKSLICSQNINAYGINTRIFSIDPVLSLSVLARKIFKLKSIEPIELFDIYTLHSRWKQSVEHSLFEKKEIKSLVKRILKTAGALGSRKLRKIDTENFRIVLDTNMEKYFNYKIWLPELKI